MTFYLASLLYGEGGTITATYQEHSSPPPHGVLHQPQLDELLSQQIPMTLELTWPGGPTPLGTPEAKAGGRTAGKSE